MNDLAYLAPVGPFAGLSNSTRQAVSERFPALSIDEIESAAASFSTELEASATDPRLASARDQLNSFARELARFQGAFDAIRRHRVGDAVAEASRMTNGQNELDKLERSVGNLRRAVRQTSRALPPGHPQLAGRRLVARLAKQLKQAGLPAGGAATDLLVGLVDLIFEDMMVGGNAACAVRDWQRSEGSETDSKPAIALSDLVIC